MTEEIEAIPAAVAQMVDNTFRDSFKKAQDARLSRTNLTEFTDLRRHITSSYHTMTIDRFSEAEADMKLAEDKTKEITERAFNSDLNEILANHRLAFSKLREAFIRLKEKDAILEILFAKEEGKLKELYSAADPRQVVSDEIKAEVELSSVRNRELCEQLGISNEKVMQRAKKEALEQHAELATTEQDGEAAYEAKMQLKAVEFIRTFTEKNNKPPSHTEVIMAKELGGSVNDRAKALKHLIFDKKVESAKVGHGRTLKLVT